MSLRALETHELSQSARTAKIGVETKGSSRTLDDVWGIVKTRTLRDLMESFFVSTSNSSEL